MKNVLQKIKQFMQRSYGVDNFSRFLFGLLIFITFLNIFIRHISVTVIYSALFLYLTFRMFSRNYAQRRKENTAYLKMKTKISKPFINGWQFLKDFPTLKYFKCPNCKATVRIPRKKGKVKITCPKCKHVFEGKS